MKVLHVCETVKGGIATYLNELLPLITDTQNDLICRTILPDVHAGELQVIEGNTPLYFKRKSRLLGLLFLGVTSFRAILDFKPDIVHIHSTFAGVIVRPICFVLRKPVVYCPHGWATDMAQSRVKKSLIIFVEKSLSLITHKIIAISNWERTQAVEMGLNAGKIVTVHNGISQTPPAASTITWDDARIKLLFVGRFDRQKGLDVLLEAVSKFEGTISLKVIGEAVNDQSPVVSTSDTYVEYLGWKTSAEVSAYMAAADAIVVPSRWEGFGLVAIEATRVSKAVIAAKVGGLQDIVIDQETGYLFEKENVTALQEIIGGLDKKTLDTMGQKGHKVFTENFISPLMAQKIISIYEEC